MAASGDEATLMSVPVERGASWNAGAPTKLFSGRFLHVDFAGAIGGGRTYDVSSDGQRFLMIKDRTDGTQGAAPMIVVVQHWDQELKRLVPAK